MLHNLLALQSISCQLDSNFAWCKLCSDMQFCLHFYKYTGDKNIGKATTLKNVSKAFTRTIISSHDCLTTNTSYIQIKSTRILVWNSPFVGFNEIDLWTSALCFTYSHRLMMNSNTIFHVLSLTESTCKFSNTVPLTIHTKFIAKFTTRWILTNYNRSVFDTTLTS